jgi:hypothetical protein
VCHGPELLDPVVAALTAVKKIIESDAAGIEIFSIWPRKTAKNIPLTLILLPL